MDYLPVIGIIIALAAFFIAFRNLRLSHSCVVKIWDCKAGPSYSIEGGPRLRFEIFLQNIGLPLHKINMSLSFRSPGGYGIASYPLKTANGDHTKDGQFAKGMITAFVIDPSYFQPHDEKFLLSITDFKLQQPMLTLFSEGFRACSWPLVPRFDRLRRFWNRFASRINHLSEARIGPNELGGEVIRQRLNLPKFVDPAAKLRFFLWNLEDKKRWMLHDPADVTR